MSNPTYQSRERVYALDANGQPAFLKYAVGDDIPEDEAIRQGIIPDPAATKKVAKTSVEDKAIKPAAKSKPATSKE